MENPLPPRNTSRQHTFQACRLLHRPKEVPDFTAAVEDLVEDVVSGHIRLHESDVDGSSTVALALRGWNDMRNREAHLARMDQERGKPMNTPTVIQYPLPGSAWNIDPSHQTRLWQRPAAALVWAGANPFSNWPEDNQLAWGQSENERKAKCGVLAAIQEEAWDVLEQCLRHPDCPPAQAFDNVRASRGRPLLEVVVNNDRGRQLLLGYGLNPNVVGPNGRTPLFHADNIQAVKEMLQAGADPAFSDDNADDAPTYWGRILKSPTALINAWREHSPQTGRGNGRMVVSVMSSNSVKAMTAALNASGWSPKDPVDPKQHPTRRLLPAAAVMAVKHARGAGQPAPVAPLRELLENPRFSSIWTDEERAWAACAALLIQGLPKAGLAFTQASLKANQRLLANLMEDPKVAALVGTTFLPFLEALELGRDSVYQAENLWKSWLTALPIETGGTDPMANGLHTLTCLWQQPHGVGDEVVLSSGGLVEDLFLRLAENKFGGMDEDLLLSSLKIRSWFGYHEGLVAADEAWMKAWEALPQRPRFPEHLPFVRDMWDDMEDEKGIHSSAQSKQAAMDWKQWALAANLKPAAPRTKAPRF